MLTSVRNSAGEAAFTINRVDPSQNLISKNKQMCNKKKNKSAKKLMKIINTKK